MRRRLPCAAIGLGARSERRADRRASSSGAGPGTLPTGRQAARGTCAWCREDSRRWRRSFGAEDRDEGR